MKFTKMQGCGNDYVYIDGFSERISPEKKPELVRKLSDRHFGIGGDGVIFINPSEEADFEMEMYNADGTRAEMCGNGIRCVGKFVYDKGLTDSEHITVVSGGKIKYLDLIVKKDKSPESTDSSENGGNPGDEENAGKRENPGNGKKFGKSKNPADRGTVTDVRVNMGSPVLESELIPVKSEKEKVIGEPILVDGEEYRMTCVSMGNPHAVIFTDKVAELLLEKTGPFFENHEVFPRRVNTEFVEVLDRKTVFMRVWERGTGETLACGTGCCAVAVAGVLNGVTDNEITVRLLGGELRIHWDQKENVVYMTGPAVTVFEGEIVCSE